MKKSPVSEQCLTGKTRQSLLPITELRYDRIFSFLTKEAYNMI